MIIKTRNTFFLALIAVASALPMRAQQAERQPGWQHLDPQHDTVFGLSTNRAYRELLKGKPWHTVIVGIIDAGVDTTQEDLHTVLWRDPKTGIRGWNYIGPETGREDVTQLVAEKKTFYDSLVTTGVPETYRASFEAHRMVEGQLAGKRNAMQRLVNELTVAQAKADHIVLNIGKSNPTAADFRSYAAHNPEDSSFVNVILRRRDLYTTWGEYRDAEISSILAMATYHLAHGLNLDNIEKDTATGNADVTPDKLGAVRDPNPTAYHGTHVAGIIGAVRGNGMGIDGVADHVQLLTIKNNGNIRELRDLSLAKGIRFAVDHGAKVINLSFGKPYSWNKAAVDAAVKYAMAHDVLLVHAAGNTGDDIDHEPHYPNPVYADGNGRAAAWLEVGASGPRNNAGVATGFSNYGKHDVDVFAPGVDIRSTLPYNQYDSWEGTSMAAPMVTGVAALIREYYPALTAVQVKDIIIKSVVKSPYLTEKCSSGGVVNAYNALQLAATYDSKGARSSSNGKAFIPTTMPAVDRAIADSISTRQALEQALSQPVPDDSVGRTTLEQLVARYTALPDAAPLVSAQAELRIARLYGSGDIRRRTHVDRAASFVSEMPAAVQRSDKGRTALCESKSMFAAHAMQIGDVMGSLAAVDACIAQLGDQVAAQAVTTDSMLIAGGDINSMFERIPLLYAQRERLRYTLVGHTGPAPITATHWGNAPPGTTHVDLSAPLTIVEFASPRCKLCEQAHGAVRDLLARYKARGVRALVVTYLEGKTPTTDSATAEQEVAYDRGYWAGQLGETVPVAITTYSPHDLTFLLPRPALFRAYGANGSPTFFLIDQHGIIRDVLEGHDPDLEARLSATIERLVPKP